jgi:hypothetical protein
LSPSRQWPALGEILSFRKKVREIVNDVIINRLPLEDGSEINYAHPFWIIIMGIEHEKIHLETTTCLIRQLPLRVIKEENNYQSIFRAKDALTGRALEEASMISQNQITVPDSEVILGRAHTGFKKNNDTAYYGWDNEFGTHEARVKSFKVSDKLTSNA